MSSAHLARPAANWRHVSDAAPALAEPTTIAEWWKNRRGESIRLVLNRYEGRDVLDLRTWYTGDDGKLKPARASPPKCDISRASRRLSSGPKPRRASSG